MTEIMFFVLARSGSKRYSFKNVREFIPYPSPQTIVDVAIGKCLLLTERMNAKVVLDTDIDPLAREYRFGHGEKIIVFDRELRFCGDDVNPADIVMSHLKEMDEEARPKHVVLTQATSPFWDRYDLETALRHVHSQNLPGMFSVNLGYKPNGCFYIVRTKDFMDQGTFFVKGSGLYRMNWSKSIDIDHEWDFIAAQAYANDRVIGLRGE
jgi:CMP-N-acetylneuraminic acid synthetase